MVDPTQPQQQMHQVHPDMQMASQQPLLPPAMQLQQQQPIIPPQMSQIHHPQQHTPMGQHTPMSQHTPLTQLHQNPNVSHLSQATNSELKEQLMGACREGGGGGDDNTEKKHFSFFF